MRCTGLYGLCAQRSKRSHTNARVSWRSYCMHITSGMYFARSTDLRCHPTPLILATHSCRYPHILLSGLYPHMWRAFGQHAVAAAWRLCVHDVPSFVLVQKRQADTARLISILLCRVGLWDRTHSTPCPGVCTCMLQAGVLQEAFCRLQCSQLLTSSTPASYSCWEHSNQSVVSPNRNVAGLQTDRIWAYLSIFCSVDLLSRQQQHEWRCSTCLSVACCET